MVPDGNQCNGTRWCPMVPNGKMVTKAREASLRFHIKTEFDSSIIPILSMFLPLIDFAHLVILHTCSWRGTGCKRVACRAMHKMSWAPFFHFSLNTTFLKFFVKVLTKVKGAKECFKWVLGWFRCFKSVLKRCYKDSVRKCFSGQLSLESIIWAHIGGAGGVWQKMLILLMWFGERRGSRGNSYLPGF